MAQGINLGSIYADLSVDSSNLERGLANGRKAMDAFVNEVLRLDRELAVSSISLAEHGRRTRELAGEYGQLVAAMETAYLAQAQTGSAIDVINASMGQATNSSGHLARGMMQLGYVVDDIQYGFQSVVNNISPLVYSFTAAAGAAPGMATAVAAASQVIVVAAYQAYTHWDDFMDLLGQGVPTPPKEGLEAIKDELKEVAKAIDDIHAKKRISVVEEEALKRLEKYKEFLEGLSKDQKQIEGLDDKTKEETQRGNAFKDAVEDQGKGAITKILEDHFKQTVDKQGTPLGMPDAKKMLENAGIDLSEEMTPDQIQTLNTKYGLGLDSQALQKNKDAHNTEGKDLLARLAIGTSTGGLAGMGGGALFAGVGALPGMAIGVGTGAAGALGSYYAHTLGYEPLKDPNSINNQVLRAMAGTKTIRDAKGNPWSGEGYARDMLLRGLNGDQTAADFVAGLAGPDSAFTKNYDENSPEAKAAEKARKAKAAADKKAAKENDDLLDAEQDAFDRSLADRRAAIKRRDDWSKKQVDALSKGDLGTKAIGGTVSEGTVEARLKLMGLDPDRIRTTKSDITRRLNLWGDREVANEAAQRGEDIGSASTRLQRERSLALRRERNRDANERLPGIDTAAKTALLEGTALTGNPQLIAEQLIKQISHALQGMGMGSQASVDEAKAVVDEARKKAQEEIMEEAANSHAKQRKTDVFDATNLATKIQSSVGENYPKTQTELLRKSVEYLAKIATFQGNTIKFGPGGGAGMR